jgi:nucleoside-diphosphate-sugar epimerase
MSIESKEKSIVVTGGAGYCGSRLVPQLLAEGHDVTVYDTLFFGKDFLPLDHPKLKVVEGDIRDTRKLTQVFVEKEVVVNLACISNDASFELDESLSTSVNLEAFEPMVVAAKKQGVKRFIYASSSSVYGVSDQPNVTEEHPLVPLTLYNKYKGMCEPLLQKHIDEDFVGIIFRPATICGYAPRQRLDLSVNILTNLAINNRKITIFGGNQMRPNLHIQDYCDVIKLLINVDKKKVNGQVFNVGYQNLTILEIAEKVREIVQIEFPGEEIAFEVSKSDDNRSYHINSDKIKNTIGFTPRYSIEHAITELCEAFKSGKLPNSLSDDRYFNVKRLKTIRAS